MRPSTVSIMIAVFSLGVAVGPTLSPIANAQSAAPAALAVQCGSGAPQLRTTLYFGLARPKGSVSELEWQLFLRDQVTSRFPEGLTVWGAQGQWRRPDGAIDHEQSKVLLLVHPDTPAALASVQEVIARYRQAFDQESVLWETARVCAVV